MSSSLIALILGLALLGVAIVLILRANSTDSLTDATTDQPQSSPEAAEVHEPAGSSTPAVSEGAHAAATKEREKEREEEQGASYARVSRSGLTLSGVKKRRRLWAQNHGFEYTREDPELVYDWPLSLLGEYRAEIPVAKDVVSGFTDGHRTHIADVGTATVLAMLRDGYSQVDVHYTVDEGFQPEGMRRVEALDQKPFMAFTSDIRALDHMVDVRVEDSLTALSSVATDVAWSGQWVVLRINRKLDTSVWEEIFPHVRMLADAAMVLPPEHVSIPLEMDSADPTRPIPGGENVIDLDEIADLSSAASRSEGTQSQQSASSRAGHLRAMPDASSAATSSVQEQPAYNDPRLDSSGSQEDGDSHDSTFRSGELFGGESFDEYDERPEITRPAEPVEFPSRSTGHVGGNTDTFRTFRVADASDGDDYTSGGVGGRSRSGHIPRLGEDPAHRAASNDQRGQIIRNDGSEATIFRDYDGDADYGSAADYDGGDEYTDDGIILRAEAEPVSFGSFSDTAAGGEGLSEAARLRRQRRYQDRYRSAGRHRAPDARHARPEPIEPVEVDIETVDAEIVDED
ncbi:hypothetical protein [Corynebacterium anserum]|uniref:Uncharacterized protein n=1 Tax=Corynebacterium anserum TaxID=2684406 RepID=A0A7G7YLU8_9CORY|nr:hypothetical protein [Corynebacterium anserum]MBC2681366.1 hypothetical protein [Corynebacterium anserum]QNH95468.1 hypothetical protein GP473_00995 [Corynebacterium anserum]